MVVMLLDDSGNEEEEGICEIYSGMVFSELPGGRGTTLTKESKVELCTNS